MQEGRIIFYNPRKAYGFVRDGEEHWECYFNLQRSPKLLAETVRRYSRVSFDVEQDERGRPIATNVCPLPNLTPCGQPCRTIAAIRASPAVSVDAMMIVLTRLRQDGLTYFYPDLNGMQSAEAIWLASEQILSAQEAQDLETHLFRNPELIKNSGHAYFELNARCYELLGQPKLPGKEGECV